ncbi:MAG: hypothetical protein ABSB36_09935, partial [Candidatus Dormibacteria bacterium]
RVRPTPTRRRHHPRLPRRRHPTHPGAARTTSPRRHPRRSRSVVSVVTPQLGPAGQVRATAAI